MSANIGALTTTFTPSASDCLTSVFYGTNSIGPWLQLGLTATSSCLPSDFNRDASIYYSPGICPSGYTYACTMQSTSSTSAITIATCCPSGYYCRQPVETSQIFACVSSFASAATLTLSSYSFNSASVPSGTTTFPVTPGQTVRAYGPIVRRAASDPVWVDALPTTTVAAPSDSSTASSAPGGGLSTGAKAGIGVGVAVGVLLVVAACAGGFAVGKRVAQRRGAGARGRAGQATGEKAGELMGSPVQELAAGQERCELYPAQISELDGAQRK